MSFSSRYWEHLKPSLVTEEKEVDLEAAHVPIEKPEQEPSREAHRFIVRKKKLHPNLLINNNEYLFIDNG